MCAVCPVALEKEKKQKIINFIVASAFSSSCRYGWQTQFFQNSTTTNSTARFHSIVIANLTQNTQYAYYVKTQVVPNENEEQLNLTSQGQSDIKYFRTEADVPSMPFVQTLSKSHDSLTLIWQPFFVNERIEYYRLDYFIQPEEHDVLDERDYCENPRVEFNTAIEPSDQRPSPSDPKLNCKAEYERWRLRNLDVTDPENAWRKYRRAECAARPAHIAKGESTVQAMSYIESYPLNLCELLGDGKCAIQSDFESLRFARRIHDLVTTNDNNDNKSSSAAMNPIDEEPNYGANYMGRIEFPNTVQRTTIDHLKPYTMYVFKFYSCMRPKNCSKYFLYYDRTDAAATADNIDLEVMADPYETNRVYLDFDEPKQPNGLTVAFQIEKHDLSNFKVTTACITRKQHYDKGKR